MKIVKISHITYDTPKKYYDVVNAYPYNNFLVKTKSGYICSHNCFFDEISFIRNKDIDAQKQIANDMLDTAIGGMKTRYIYQGKNPTMLILASSKRSEKSFLEEHMKKKLKSEKENVYISDGSVWEVKPKGTYSSETFKVAVGTKFLPSLVLQDGENVSLYKEKGYSKILDVPIDFRAEFLDDIERALCDFAGISSSEISKYINAQLVKDVVTDSYSNPFVQEILEIGDDPEDRSQYYDYFNLNKVSEYWRNKPLFIHLDMSINGDMTGISGVWIKGKAPSKDPDNPSKDLFFRLAFSVSIKAPKGRQISFEKNRNFIRWLRKQGFNIKGVTSDTFQSYDLQQQLKAEGFNCEILSVDRVDPSSHICIPYQYFRSTIYEHRVEMFEDKTLFTEIIDLERNINNGAIDHPNGGRKDACDAFCGALFNASKHAEEYSFDYGENLDLTLKVNQSSNLEVTKQQINIEFENEMKNLFSTPITPSAPKSSSANIEQSTINTLEPDEESPYMDFGLGRAEDILDASQFFLAQGIVTF